jgi:hypothetical protein
LLPAPLFRTLGIAHLEAGNDLNRVRRSGEGFPLRRNNHDSRPIGRFLDAMAEIMNITATAKTSPAATQYPDGIPWQLAGVPVPRLSMNLHVAVSGSVLWPVARIIRAAIMRTVAAHPLLAVAVMA